MNLKVYFYERKKYDLTREVTLFQCCQAGAGGAEIIFCSQFVGYQDEEKLISTTTGISIVHYCYTELGGRVGIAYFAFTSFACYRTV